MTTAPMSAEELKRLAQLNKDRTQGEWLYFDHAHACVAVSDVHYKVLLTCSQKEIDAAEHDPRQCYGDDVVREGIRNVKFAVAAANAMPRLLDHIAALEAERDALRAAGALKVNADVIAMILSEAGVTEASYLAVKIANELDPPNSPNYDAVQVARLYLLLGKPDAPTATLSHEAARRVAEFQAAYARGLEDAAGVAEEEPEVPGPMPEALRHYDVEHVAQTCVRVAKRNIAAAIRALAQKGE